MEPVLKMHWKEKYNCNKIYLWRIITSKHFNNFREFNFKLTRTVPYFFKSTTFDPD